MRGVINIRSPAWYAHLPNGIRFFDLKTQLRENGLHVGFGNLKAGQLMHPGGRKAHGFFAVGHRARAHRRTHGAAANFNNHLHSQRQTRFNRGRINAALKAIARIAINIVVTARQRNRHRLEPRAFHQHVFCLKRTARRQTAHNTSQAQHALIIGDDAIGGVQLVRFLVQRDKAFARLGGARLHSAGQRIGVIDM